MIQPLLPLTAPGPSRRDQGIAQVLEHERKRWRVSALSAIVELAKRHRTFTADEVREACAELGEPHHPNIWGAIMRTAATDGVIERTNELRVFTRPEAHGHSNPVWRSCIYLNRSDPGRATPLTPTRTGARGADLEPRLTEED